MSCGITRGNPLTTGITKTLGRDLRVFSRHAMTKESNSSDGYEGAITHYMS